MYARFLICMICSTKHCQVSSHFFSFFQSRNFVGHWIHAQIICFIPSPCRCKKKNKKKSPFWNMIMPPNYSKLQCAVPFERNISFIASLPKGVQQPPDSESVYASPPSAWCFPRTWLNADYGNGATDHQALCNFWK